MSVIDYDNLIRTENDPDSAGTCIKTVGNQLGDDFTGRTEEIGENSESTIADDSGYSSVAHLLPPSRRWRRCRSASQRFRRGVRSDPRTIISMRGRSWRKLLSPERL